MRRRWLLLMLAPFAFALFIALGGMLVQLLWNALLPPLFGVARVSFWQALGILILCRILFGGFGLGGSSGTHYRRRWQAMTPEERERIRERMRVRVRERWSFHTSGDDSATG